MDDRIAKLKLYSRECSFFIGISENHPAT